MTDNPSLDTKLQSLIKRLKKLDSVLVAFSGGVDSTLLLYIAHEQLGAKCVAATAASPLTPERELNQALLFCAEHNIEQIVVERNELNLMGFANNEADRCYICKLEMMSNLKDLAASKNLKHVIEGSNLDDDGDYRPGARAVSELGVLSPLRASALSKDEIRELSARFGLSTATKPSFACLATRIPFGEPITEAALERIDRAEQLLIDCGFKQVRVRSHGDVARIELNPQDFEAFYDLSLRRSVHEALMGFGYKYVSLDLAGYQSGSLNP